MTAGETAAEDGLEPCWEPGAPGGGVGGVVVMQSALAVHTQSAPSLLRTHSDPFRVMGEEKKVLLMPTKKKKLALLFLDYC